MRARPREVNIFNMSLLDILCGALGAFCFMMLVALPYYVVSRGDRAESQKRTEELMKDVEKLREKMSDPEQAEELRNLIDQLEAQIKQLQGELNQAEHENEQLRAENTSLTSENNGLRSENTRLTSENAGLRGENERLTKDNETLKSDNDFLRIENQLQKDEIAAKSPFAVIASSVDPRASLSLFLEDVMIGGTTDKTKFPNGSFNPDIVYQTGWANDLTNISLARRGVTLWISSTTNPKSTYRVFVKFPPVPGGTENFPGSDQRHETRVMLDFAGHFARNPGTTWVNLTPRRHWVLAGTLNIDEKGQLSYAEATDTERDDAWRAIMKTEVPSPTPIESMTPIPGMSEEEMKRLREMAKERQRQIEEEKRRQQQQGISPAPSASPSGAIDEQERARRERLLREQLERRPVPSPSASP